MLSPEETAGCDIYDRIGFVSLGGFNHFFYQRLEVVKLT